jgi:SSS family solute:Na+ symporter/sodium/proline symporter
MVIVLGIWAFLQITWFENVLQAALYAYTMYGAGVTPAVLGAFFWKRATPLAGALSVGTGMTATLLWEFLIQPALGESVLGSVDPVIPAVVLSVGVLIAVSLAQRPPDPETWRPFFT